MVRARVGARAWMRVRVRTGPLETAKKVDDPAITLAVNTFLDHHGAPPPQWIWACQRLALSLFRLRIECFGLNGKKFGLPKTHPG